MARKRRESDKRYYLNHRIEILEKQKEYVSRNKEKTKEYHKEYYSKNKESIKERMKKSGVSPRGRIAVRLDALIHYGGPSPACDCCGEDRYEFLCLDHINGGGTRHVKERGNTNLAQWLRVNNYPEGYRVLCHNCNMALGMYGYCPHEYGGIKIESWLRGKRPASTNLQRMS